MASAGLSHCSHANIVLYIYGLCVLAACSSMSPRLETGTYAPQRSSRPLVLVDEAKRVASPGEYRDLMKENAPDIGTRTMLEQLLAVTQGISGGSLCAGNDARLLVDGPSTFKAMFKDIERARDHIYVETYTLEDDVIGNALADRLIASSQRGVDVRVLVDGFGSLGLSEAYIERLREHGVELRIFHPLDPTVDPRIWRSVTRDHRKILVVDGHVAYTGGINFSGVYNQSSLAVPREARDTDGAWRDTDIRIVGPVVRQFQKLFLEMWNNDPPEKERIGSAGYIPALDAKGDMVAGVIASSGGDDVEYDIYSILAAAIGHAQQRVWITQAYFAPGDTFTEIIKTAAQRGVDVRLLLPGVSDAPLVIQASRSSYEDLLEAGVRIYERTGSTLHAKTVVVDGVWTSIGSTNYDYRSFVHNFELNVVVVSRDLGSAMEKLYQVDLQEADEITLQAWRKRSLIQRMKEGLGRILQRWL
jgi:cardiolipin synthase